MNGNGYAGNRGRTRAGGRWFAALSLVLVFAMRLPAQTVLSGGTNRQPVQAVAPRAADLLVFLDGSTVHGSLRMIDGASGVRWVHPDAQKPIDFLPRNLYQIKFASRPLTAVTNDQPSCILRFRNGDEIFGNLIALDGANLTLETWFAGQLTAPRDAIQSLTFLSRGMAVVYQGITGPQGWKIGPVPDAWTYQDGAFTTQRVGYLGRDVHLPPMSRMEFDLNWSGQLNMVLSVYTDAIDQFNFSSTAYMLYLGAGYVNVQRVQGGVGTTHLGQAQVNAMREKNRAHMEIRVNREKATLALLVDGNLVEEWKDQAGFVSQGTGVAFYSQRVGAMLRLSNLKVSQWDGRYEQSQVAYTNVTETIVGLVNSDQATGKLESIRDGKVNLLAAGARLQVPLQRVTEIVMPTASPRSFKQTGDIRAYFTGGGNITLKIDKWDNQKVAGVSANFGAIQLKPEWVRQLQFNLDQAKSLSDDLDIDADDGFWSQE